VTICLQTVFATLPTSHFPPASHDLIMIVKAAEFGWHG
jgi:hypothetical protein